MVMADNDLLQKALLLLAVYEFLKICMEVVSATFNPQWSHFMLLFTTVPTLWNIIY